MTALIPNPQSQITALGRCRERRPFVCSPPGGNSVRAAAQSVSNQSRHLPTHSPKARARTAWRRSAFAGGPHPRRLETVSMQETDDLRLSRTRRRFSSRRGNSDDPKTPFQLFLERPSTGVAHAQTRDAGTYLSRVFFVVSWAAVGRVGRLECFSFRTSSGVSSRNIPTLKVLSEIGPIRTRLRVRTG